MGESLLHSDVARLEVLGCAGTEGLASGENPDLRIFDTGGPLPTLCHHHGKPDEVESSFKSTQEIFEKSLGRDHLNMDTTLFNRASSLEIWVRGHENSSKILGAF